MGKVVQVVWESRCDVHDAPRHDGDAFQLTRVTGPIWAPPTGCSNGLRRAASLSSAITFNFFPSCPLNCSLGCSDVPPIMNTIPEQDESTDNLERRATQVSQESQTASEYGQDSTLYLLRTTTDRPFSYIDRQLELEADAREILPYVTIPFTLHESG